MKEGKKEKNALLYYLSIENAFIQTFFIIVARDVVAPRR